MCNREVSKRISTNAIPKKDISKRNPKKDAQRFMNMWKSLPTLKPLDKEKIHTLRVLYVEDPLLPALSENQKSELLKETVRLTKTLLGFKIRFQVMGKENINAFFSRMRDYYKKPDFRYIVLDWPVSINDQEKVKSAIEKQIKKHDHKRLIRYFGKPSSGRSMNEHVYKVFTKRLKAIYNEKDLNNQPLYNQKRSEWMSFPHWDVIAYHLKKADFIITNIVIAGPDSDMPIYVINRGGVTSAFVENNLFNQYRAVGIFATYQYLSQGAYFTKARGSLPKKELISAIAHLFVHELGHFLSHIAEYYDLKGSVHVAPVDLDYLRWYKAIDHSIHPADITKLRLLKKY